MKCAIILLTMLMAPVCGALCFSDTKIMSFKLVNASQVSEFLGSSTGITKMQPREPSTQQNITLKDPQCIANAIRSFDPSKYIVLKVRASVDGWTYADGHFEPGRRMTVILQVANRNTSLIHQVSNLGSLDKSNEFIECEIE